MQINSTLSTQGGMQHFCLWFGEEVNTSLSQQLQRSTTYGTWGDGGGGSIVHIRVFGQTLRKRERYVIEIRETE